jgi:WXG100 family type VII secretion target
MSAESLHVDTSALAAAGQFADRMADQLADRYSQLSAAVTTLLDSGWKGSSADACGDAWREWSDGFRLVVMGLRDEATAMQLAANQYASADGDGASTIAAL